MLAWGKDATLSTVLAGSQELIMVVDRDHKIVLINQLITPLRREEIIGQTPYDLVPEYRETIVACFEQVLATGEPGHYECHYESEGQTSHWSSRVIPIVDSGVIQGMTLFSRDVTAERLQKDERDKFFQLSNDLLCSAGLDCYFKSVSPSFSRILGYDEDELLSSSFLEFVHPDDIEATTAIIEQMGADGSIDDFENRYITKDGRLRLIHWSGVFDFKSERIYAVGRDVTEKRRLEEQLLQSRKLDAVGQLAGGLAHDFNNILLAVMMNASIASRSVATPGVQDSLGEILEACERASSLTRQLLTFSSSDVFEPTTVDLGEVVRDLHGMLRRLLPESIDIEFAQTGQSVPVSAVQGQIEQAIVNLALNARDAIPASGGVLRFVVETATGDNAECALLRVIDNGCGMAAELQSRIFEPFFTTKERGSGTGLGLSSVYTVMARHGGRVEVESTPGQGTEMQLWMPLASDLPASTVTPDDSPNDEKAMSGKTILVAEDDAQLCTVVAQLLELEGYRVVLGRDGAEAIALLQTSQFDLALLDLVMPKASGHEVYLSLRERHPKLPVVFSTGHADGLFPLETLNDENVALVRKPYAPDDLLSIIARRLRHSQ